MMKEDIKKDLADREIISLMTQEELIYCFNIQIVKGGKA